MKTWLYGAAEPAASPKNEILNTIRKIPERNIGAPDALRSNDGEAVISRDQDGAERPPGG